MSFKELYTIEPIKIDPMTGNTKNVGDLGIDVSGNQALDFDDTTGTLYWSSCNLLGCGTLRTIDITTGDSSFYEAIGTTIPMGFQIQYGGFAIAKMGYLIFYNGFE